MTCSVGIYRQGVCLPPQSFMPNSTTFQQMIILLHPQDTNEGANRFSRQNVFEELERGFNS